MRPDPRGPTVAVTETMPGMCDGNHYTLACGHTTSSPPRLAVNKIGTLMRCYDCGREQLALWEAQNAA